jgi:hypothetical protein
MTAQINDTFFYQDELYEIAGISEGELFDPAAFGMEPTWTRSSCWRGWQAQCALTGRQLVVDALNVNLFDRDKLPGSFVRVPGPPIGGVLPVDDEQDVSENEDEDEEARLRREIRHSRSFSNRYENLGYPLAFTGGLLLAAGFIRDLYLHMGFHPAWKYGKVIELVFEGGVLQKECDRSAETAELRNLVLAQAEQGDARARRPDASIRKYIERAFDRRY